MCDINIILKHKPLSEEILKRRGVCCSNKCINCPYYPKYSGSKILKQDILDQFCAFPCTQKTKETGDCECHNNLK